MKAKILLALTMNLTISLAMANDVEVSVGKVEIPANVLERHSSYD